MVGGDCLVRLRGLAVVLVSEEELAAEAFGELGAEQGAGGVRSRPTLAPEQPPCYCGGEVRAVAEAEPALTDCSSANTCSNAPTSLAMST